MIPIYIKYAGTNLRNTKDINKINEHKHTLKGKIVFKTIIKIML
jgi:hypothetical protein